MKSFDEALKADGRHQLFMFNDPVTGLRPITFADHHADVCRLNLPPVGADLVERLYERAQHCLLYAWFDYELTLLAEGQAFTSLDLALKVRVADVKVPNFGPRLRRAVDAGWIAPPPSRPTGASDEWQSTHQLLVHLRNEIMHGTAQVHDFSMAAVVFDHVRAMICQLHGVEPPPGPQSSLWKGPLINGFPVGHPAAHKPPSEAGKFPPAE